MEIAELYQLISATDDEPNAAQLLDNDCTRVADSGAQTSVSCMKDSSPIHCDRVQTGIYEYSSRIGTESSCLVLTKKEMPALISCVHHCLYWPTHSSDRRIGFVRNHLMYILIHFIFCCCTWTSPIVLVCVLSQYIQYCKKLVCSCSCLGIQVSSIAPRSMAIYRNETAVMETEDDRQATSVGQTAVLTNFIKGGSIQKTGLPTVLSTNDPGSLNYDLDPEISRYLSPISLEFKNKHHCQESIYFNPVYEPNTELGSIDTETERSQDVHNSNNSIIIQKNSFMFCSANNDQIREASKSQSSSAHIKVFVKVLYAKIFWNIKERTEWCRWILP